MRYLIVTKKQILTAVCAVLTLTAAIVGSMQIFAASAKKLPVYCVETEKKQIAISFDAAWGNDDTQTLIDILAKYKVPATFFVVGEWVDKYPESVKAISDAGHEIQNHSDTHPYLTKLSKDKMKAEITACNEKIKKITGKAPTLIRPPYGDYNNTVVETVGELGMTAVQWSVDSLDWQPQATADSICKRVLSRVENGSIILCHNDADHTPEALPKILECLQKDGYEFVFISDLILKDNYEIDNTGKQCKCK